MEIGLAVRLSRYVKRSGHCLSWVYNISALNKAQYCLLRLYDCATILASVCIIQMKPNFLVYQIAVLTEGRQLYMGPPDCAIDWCKLVYIIY